MFEVRLDIGPKKGGEVDFWKMDVEFCIVGEERLELPTTLGNVLLLQTRHGQGRTRKENEANRLPLCQAG